ncbi:Gfo/Idh/MocA family protein [Nocardioides sp. SYSU DS0651]|uniref:Gfo/Idh/MocA family protein n=1 Tax=Nocardioides sp. SYSU DS0651 TaxID=3415955 RepID=UPI003F4BD579
MQPTIGWGVLAPGRIAAAFCQDLALVEDATLVAVGSRDPSRAAAFAEAHGALSAGSYAEVLADPAVDVVYVAAPHAFHAALATAALEAGKHVLCEKPLTLDPASAAALVATAQRCDRFLMEAVWTATHPVVRDLVARVRGGELGKPRELTASFCFAGPDDPADRLRDPALGGGALLDLGVYPLTLAHLLLGPPEELRGEGRLTPQGIDLDVTVAGRYPGGATATLAVAIDVDRPITATLVTDTGRVEVAAPFFCPASYTFVPEAGEPVTHTGADPVIGLGYGNEIAEVHRCLREGLRESPLVPHARTLAIMDQLDDLRRQVTGR